jgi:hypothetical protein
MHVHLPKPLHGWRAFLGEVGIIVVGVLIALSAEQVIHELQTRSDERSFRDAIDHEIGLDLFVYDVRSRQFACDAKHAEELKGWLDRARSGEQVPPLWPTPPQTFSPYRSAWDNRDAQVFNHLPAERRQKYAEFYDELSNNWEIIQREHEQWMRLIPYAEGGPITLTDRRTIRPVIAQIRSANATLRGDLPVSQKIAEVLSVKEVIPDNIPADTFKRVAGCRSAIASPSEAAAMNSKG